MVKKQILLKLKTPLVRGLTLKILLLLVLLALGVSNYTSQTSPNNLSLGEPNITNNSTVDAVSERLFWSKRIDKVGAQQAYAEFKSKYSPRHFGIQHYASHIMGELLYDKEGLPALAICDPTFAFGCYHSFFGRSLSEKGLAIIPELDKACLDKYGPLGTGCLHGIGHGLMEYFGPSKLMQALNSCLMTTQKNPLFGCTSGVFMEYNVPIIINGETAYTEFRKLDPNNPYAPCPEVPTGFQKSCYYEMGQWWDKVYNHDFAKLGQLCQNVNDLDHQEACYFGIGNVSSPSTDYNVLKTIAICKLMPDYSGQITCRSGASWSFYAEPKYRSQATEVCADLPEEVKRGCVIKADLIGEGKNATSN